MLTNYVTTHQSKQHLGRKVIVLLETNLCLSLPNELPIAEVVEHQCSKLKVTGSSCCFSNWTRQGLAALDFDSDISES